MIFLLGNQRGTSFRDSPLKEPLSILGLDNISLMEPGIGLDINISAHLLQETNVTCCNSTRSVEDDTYWSSWPFLVLALLVFAGGLGNVLVCLAICFEKRLQNVTNYFLLSLAVADLLVCVVVMPFGIVEGFLGRWPFGWRICSFWVSCDVLSCSSSILHMCFISLGRYLGIRNPLKSRASSRRRVSAKIALVWLLAMAITSPITTLAYIDPTNIQPSADACAINNKFFFLFGSVFAFYLPGLLMGVTYGLTVRLLKRKAAQLPQRQPFLRSPANGHPPTAENQTEDACKHCGKVSMGSRRSFVRIRTNHHPQQPQQQQLVPGMVRTTLGTNQVMNEQKATHVLGIVFACFVICWTPFFLLNVLSAFWDVDHPFLATTFLWLGYVSSTINPIIYTVFNRTFRRAFWKLLTCRLRTFSRHINSHNDMATWAFRSAKSASPPPELYQESTAC